MYDFETTYLVLLVDLDCLLGLGGLAELEARPLHAQREERDARYVLIEAILMVRQQNCQIYWARN